MNNRYYYWDKNFTNKYGETLQECYDNYGIGKQKLSIRNINHTMDVIYLDEKQDFGYSWCLKVYNKKRGINVPVTAYEMHRVYDPYPFKAK